MQSSRQVHTDLFLAKPVALGHLEDLTWVDESVATGSLTNALHVSEHQRQKEVFASGWIEGKQTYLGRPADIIQAKDGSILVADDWAGALYRISYDKKEAKK